MITVRFETLLDSGFWEDMCIKYGIFEYCINEGLADYDDTIEIEINDAIKWGIIKKED